MKPPPCGINQTLRRTWVALSLIFVLARSPLREQEKDKDKNEACRYSVQFSPVYPEHMSQSKLANFKHSLTGQYSHWLVRVADLATSSLRSFCSPWRLRVSSRRQHWRPQGLACISCCTKVFLTLCWLWWEARRRSSHWSLDGVTPSLPSVPSFLSCLVTCLGTCSKVSPAFIQNAQPCARWHLCQAGEEWAPCLLVGRFGGWWQHGWEEIGEGRPPTAIPAMLGGETLSAHCWRWKPEGSEGEGGMIHDVAGVAHV